MLVLGYLICDSVFVGIDFMRWWCMCMMQLWSITYDIVIHTGERNDEWKYHVTSITQERSIHWYCRIEKLYK